jgi:hypothetical protein
LGAVALGSNASRSAAITNTGTGNCTVNTLTLSATTSAEFARTAPALPLPALIPGASVNVTVVYTPTNTGDDAGALVIGSTDPDQPSISVSLAGSGTQTSQACDVVVTPLALSFGNVAVGSNAVLSTTVKNAGAAACNVTRQLLAGSSSDFAMTQTGSLTIAAGQTATLSVRYTPSAVGGDSGSLQIGSNDPAQAVVPVALAGTGFAATGKVDLAVVQLGVPSRFTLSRRSGDDDDDDDDDDDRRSSITINLVVENRGTVAQARQATVTGTLNGSQVYRRSLSVSAPLGQRKSFQFPSYSPRSTGTIRWTVVVADDISANSTASATSQVVRSDRDRDEDDEHDRDR